MTSDLHIKLSHDTSCAHRVGHVIVLQDDVAESLHIKPGHSEVAVFCETPDILRVVYREKILSLEKKGIFEGD